MDCIIFSLLCAQNYTECACKRRFKDVGLHVNQTKELIDVLLT